MIVPYAEKNDIYGPMNLVDFFFHSVPHSKSIYNFATLLIYKLNFIYFQK